MYIRRCGAIAYSMAYIMAYMCVCIVCMMAYMCVCIRAYMRVCSAIISANKKDSVENVRKPRCPFARIFLSVLATSLMVRNLAMLQVSVCIRLDERICNQQGITDLVRLQVTVTHGCCTVFYDAFEHYAPPYGYYIISHRHGNPKFSLKVFDFSFKKNGRITWNFR